MSKVYVIVLARSTERWERVCIAGEWLEHAVSERAPAARRMVRAALDRLVSLVVMIGGVPCVLV